MRKIILGLGFAAIVLCAGNSFAEESSAAKSESPRTPGAPWQSSAMEGRKMNPMMFGIPASSMAATSDGGIVVMTGLRLLKYDKDLNLVKEAELPKMKVPGGQESAAVQNTQNQAASRPA